MNNTYSLRDFIDMIDQLEYRVELIKQSEKYWEEYPKRIGEQLRKTDMYIGSDLCLYKIDKATGRSKKV